MTEAKMVKSYSEREARIKLTPKCNYRCYFCHEEGGCQSATAEWESLKALLLALKAQGRRDITFTGGEPLLNKPVLLKALAEIASWNVQPKVTLITNAALLDETVIRALEACAWAKVNVSIHDPRAEEYCLITGQRLWTPEALKPILKRLSSGPVRLKLNAVLTAGYVKDGTVRERFFNFAHEVGAYAVKFVELFPTKDCANWPQKRVPVEALEACLRMSGGVLESRSCRTTYWRMPSGLVVETTRCACAYGCARCFETRGDFFTGGTHFHPCFMSDRTISLAGRSLEDVLKEGDDELRRIINGRAAA